MRSPRRSTRALTRRLLCAGCSWLCALSPALGAPAGTTLLPAEPLVQLIDVDQGQDHSDISVQFACSMNYIGNTPVSHGARTIISLRLGLDCGNSLGMVPPELPLVGGGGDLVTGARLDSAIPGQVTLELDFAHEVDFVMAPTNNGRGLRVRLLHMTQRKGTGLVLEPDAPEGYAVNLESSQTPFGAATVEETAQALRTQAYVSETDIEGTHWYRLRVGPFSSRAEAERVLAAALPAHPRAWLAINDEQELGNLARAGTPGTGATPSGPLDAPLPDAERARLYGAARASLEQHHYPEAIDLLTRLMRQPEYPGRADAQELLGLARERSGQLAQAKGEYQAYLARYPDRPGAVRVRARLQALNAASLQPQSMGTFGVSAPQPWSFSGSAALGYQYGKEQVVSAGTTTTTTAVNAALLYGDFLVRDRGTRFDFVGRVDGGYTQNLVTTAGGSQDRTTAAFVELDDRNLGLTGRIGRQTLANQAVVGLFDGLFVGYQIKPNLSVSVAGGYPAYTSYSSFSTHQEFGTFSAEYGLFNQALVFDSYVLEETDQGTTDRRSIGFQTRYSQPGRNIVALIDYDVYFQALNAATLIGNFKATDYWILGFDLDHRHSPLLEIYNALIGQNTTDLRVLEQTLTTAQLKQAALDRTALSDTLVLSANRPLGQRWQLMLDLAGQRLGSTPASFNVPATPSTGLDKSATIQLSGSSLMQANDLHIFAVRVDESPIQRSTALSWDARFALAGAWRFGPRFSVERITDPALGGPQMLYLPEVRGDWTSRRAVFELIAGYQLERQQVLQQLSNQTGPAESSALDQRSFYISSTFRWRF